MDEKQERLAELFSALPAQFRAAMQAEVDFSQLVRFKQICFHC